MILSQWSRCPPRRHRTRPAGSHRRTDRRTRRRRRTRTCPDSRPLDTDSGHTDRRPPGRTSHRQTRTPRRKGTTPTPRPPDRRFDARHRHRTGSGRKGRHLPERIAGRPAPSHLRNPRRSLHCSLQRRNSPPIHFLECSRRGCRDSGRRPNVIRTEDPRRNILRRNGRTSRRHIPDGRCRKSGRLSWRTGRKCRDLPRRDHRARNARREA